MKPSVVILSLLVVVSGTTAFTPNQSPAFVRPGSPLSMAQVELKPEPEGGEEVTPVRSMAGSRLKNMGENPDIKSKDGETVYKFWLLSEAEAQLISKIRIQVLKDAKQKANFPGFRKGQIPPYAQPQITGFAVQEALIQTVNGAVEAYGLKSLPGSDGEINVQESVEEMSKGWKDGDSLTFTTTFSAIFDPEKKTEIAASDGSNEEEKEEVESS